MKSIKHRIKINNIKYKEQIATDMVAHIDSLLLFVGPKKIKKCNAKIRRHLISYFFFECGIIDMIAIREVGQWRYAINDKIYDAMLRKPREKEYYLSIALNCVADFFGPRRSNKWEVFAASLARMIWLEYKLFFEWVHTKMKRYYWLSQNLA
jgi:hypothetical protein